MIVNPTHLVSYHSREALEQPPKMTDDTSRTIDRL